MEKAIIYSFESGNRIEDKKEKQMEKPRKRRIRWNRVAIALAVLVLLIYGIVSMLVDVTHAVSGWATSQQSSLEKEISQYEQVTVVVDQGETAWGIQKELTPHESDIRYPLYLAKSLNPGVQMGDIQAGQVLVMLKEKDKQQH